MPTSLSSRLSRWNASSLAFLLILFTALSPQYTLAEETALPVVIVNASVDAESFSDSDLWAIFGAHYRSWPDGSRVRVFVLPDKHPVHRSFAIKKLRTYPYQLKRVWKRLAFSGTGRAPHTVKDQLEMLKRVSSTPGAIGYLAADFDTGESNVTIINP